MRYPVVLFDLFRTLVSFTPQAPTGKVHDPTWRSAMQVLRGLAAELLPEMDFEEFLDALTAASDEIAHERPPEYFEVPIAERYGQALARLGFHGPRAASAAERLSARQAEVQSLNSLVPAEHAALLRELAANRRLGLVSNYDHGRMVHDLLARHGIDRLFSATLVSIEFGRRKPHRAIFEEALRRLNAVSEDTLFVGDSLRDDVAGARGAGVDAAWFNPAGKPPPVRGPEPTYVLEKLVDLRRILAREGA
jgi:putative hydrolase of the HAD superfamily